MSILRKGIMGPITGKVGDLIYYEDRMGRQCVRRRPKPSAKAPTPQQLAQRARFGTVNRFISSSNRLYRELPDFQYHKMSPRSWATRQILLDAVIGEYPDFQIDYSKVKLFEGNWVDFLSLGAESCKEGVNFECSYFEHYLHYYWKIALIAFSPLTNQLIFEINSFSNSIGSSILQVPDYLEGQPLETWIILLGDSKMASKSYYCGRVESGSSSSSSSCSSDSSGSSKAQRHGEPVEP